MPEVPWTLTEAQARLGSGEISSVELTRSYLDRIDRFDERLGAFVARFDESAMAAAAAADRARAAGRPGPLLGVPIAVKDLIATREAATLANSDVHRAEWAVQRDAVVVARLRAAGAVILGKVTTNEYALAGPDETKPFPIPHNPWNMRRSPGGSSSGSGIAVAAGLCAGALGTDTGGSVRMPCAFNGITGLLPTFGRVPAEGVIPLAWSMDRVGPMARSAADCAQLYGVLAAASQNIRPSSPRDLRELRVGIVDAALGTANADPAVAVALRAAEAALRDMGAQLSAVSLPRYDEAVAAATLTIFGEAFDAHRDLLAEFWADYSPTTRLALVCGAFISAADYTRAQRVRALAQHELAEVFAAVDVLVMPTATIGAPYRQAGIQPSVHSFRPDPHNHTFYWNAVGNPVLAVPAGFTADGMPVGLQIAAAPFDDDLLLAVGQAFQSVTDHHLAMPREVAA